MITNDRAIDKGKSKQELSIQKKQQVERELVGKIIPHKGHTVFEINEKTLEIKEAMYIHTTYIFNQANQVNEILVREGFFYVSALNKKNAIKKFKQGLNGSKKTFTELLEF